MDPIARLTAARTAVKAGDYDAALEHHLWFHEHALEQNRAVYGVRLSYALTEWSALGERHPPARAALDRIRERDVARLLAGEGGFEQFHDVMSIDSALNQSDRTHSLVATLLDTQPEQAATYTEIVLPTLIAAGEFALAGRILPAPEARIRRDGARLNQSLGYRRYQRMPPGFIGMQIDCYATLVMDIVTMLTGSGRGDEARRLQRLAGDLIAAPRIRSEVRARMQPGAVPRFERGMPPWKRKQIS